MQELENLLNSIIKMGWKPWGIEGVDRIFCAYSKQILVGYDNTGKSIGQLNPRSLRELVSLESGLWEFVVDNKMVNKHSDMRINNYRGDNECDDNCCYDDYEYRLIESALILEKELEKFLLNNIII